MVVTRLYVVRHAATQLTEGDRFSSQPGVELSEAGRRQATLLAERLRHVGLTAIHASPFSRAVETASLIARPHALAIETHDGLREINHGRWDGLTREEVVARYGEEYAAWEKDPFTLAPEGGETGASVLARSLPVIHTIVARHPGERVLVVSHKATIRLLIASLLGFDPRAYRDRLDQAPACLNILEFRDPVRARLVLLNDTSHYE